jgi:membrane-associated protease RseP (regulator of RpoE activity)
MTTNGDNGTNFSSRARAWFERLSRVKKVLATSTALVITVGGVASATTSVLDLGERLGVRPPQAERISTVKTSVQGETRVREGVLVTEVILDSPADRAGVDVQDIITDINGEGIEDVDELEDFVKRTRPGEPLLLSIVRDSQRESLLVEPVVEPESSEDTSFRLGVGAEDIKPDKTYTVRGDCIGCFVPEPETTTSGQGPAGGVPGTYSPESAPAVDQYAP